MQVGKSSGSQRLQQVAPPQGDLTLLGPGLSHLLFSLQDEGPTLP